MAKVKGVAPKLPTPRYAVVTATLFLGRDIRAFDSADAACKYAEQNSTYSPRIFGLNPEYDFEATHTYTLKVKE